MSSLKWYSHLDVVRQAESALQYLCEQNDIDMKYVDDKDTSKTDQLIRD